MAATTTTIEPTIWHVTASNTIHKGYTSDCSHCRWKKNRKTKKEKNKKSSSTKKPGSGNGVNRGGRKRVHPPRKCTGCETTITRQNKSGYCIRCLTAKNKEEAKPKEPKRRCSSCDKPIVRGNRSGLCRKCWVNSPRAKKSRSEAQAWVNSAVFNRNATPLSKNSREGRG